jgi:hypothetical protein
MYYSFSAPFVKSKQAMEEQQATKRRKLMLRGCAIVAAYIADKFCDNDCQNEERPPGAKTIKREQTNDTDKFFVHHE